MSVGAGRSGFGRGRRGRGRNPARARTARGGNRAHGRAARIAFGGAAQGRLPWTARAERGELARDRAASRSAALVAARSRNRAHRAHGIPAWGGQPPRRRHDRHRTGRACRARTPARRGDARDGRTALVAARARSDPAAEGGHAHGRSARARRRIGLGAGAQARARARRDAPLAGAAHAALARRCARTQLRPGGRARPRYGGPRGRPAGRTRSRSTTPRCR